MCLNFLIAEATNSYNAVNENLVKYIWKQKVQMINEAENFFPTSAKTQYKFPKYIITREAE